MFSPMCFAVLMRALLSGCTLRNGISGYRPYVNSACAQTTLVFSKEVGPGDIDPGSTASDLIPTPVTSLFLMDAYVAIFQHSFTFLCDMDYE